MKTFTTPDIERITLAAETIMDDSNVSTKPASENFDL